MWMKKKWNSWMHSSLDYQSTHTIHLTSFHIQMRSCDHCLFILQWLTLSIIQCLWFYLNLNDAILGIRMERGRLCYCIAIGLRTVFSMMWWQMNGLYLLNKWYPCLLIKNWVFSQTVLLITILSAQKILWFGYESITPKTNLALCKEKRN